jgi:phosphoglycerate-specific signal transduction histidine kinase
MRKLAMTINLSDVVADQHKEALKTTSAVLQEKSNEGRDALQKIEHATQNLQANTKKAKVAIFQQEQEILDEFTKKLKRNTAVFRDQVDKTHNEVNEKLSKQRDDMKVYVEKVNGSLDLAKNIIEKGSKEDVVLFTNEIKVNANNIEKECPKMIQPVHNGDIEYRAKSIQTIVDNINLNDLGNVGRLIILKFIFIIQIP